ncbi:EF hand domain containing protein [Acanthamoeba castellanii str. Neff]|uniref:EF hand domain containing protein n=1 Tax=Acanthamoeba castellanii (strain ATCC 30010 / Neff) TaxID=1257118 RepID=L8GHE2_ACACF|nr:EF hand domain containing protein [Acanthamoeba castellanii str. Neff]ELR12153.1 EF hand domain containing protein [Acanthamoeba castellanii str. Neff]
MQEGEGAGSTEPKSKMTRNLSFSGQFRVNASRVPAPVVNPFINESIAITGYEWFKLVVGSVLLAPIRLVLILLLLVLAVLLVKIALLGLSVRDIHDKPFTRWRKNVLLLVRYMARALLFVWGFYYIPVKGKQADFDEAPILVSNHVSMFDVLFFYYYELPRFISRKENIHMPFVGTVLCAMQGILVDRKDPDSRKKAVEAINEHANKSESEGWPRLLVFPEGTCTNQKALISFKSGAFNPGKPVQPVAIRHPFIHFDPCWVNGINLPLLMWRSLCQFSNYLQVTYLPVHKPSKYEKANPQLFANNVRAQIARALNIPTTEHGFDDVSFAMEAMKLQERPEGFGEVDLKHLREYTRMSQEDLNKLLKKFSKFDNDRSGDITFHEFREALGLPNSDYVKRLFRLLDTDDSGSISWKKYISGIALLSEEVRDDEAIKFAFKLFDQNDDGRIEQDELFAILSNVITTISPDEVEQIFTRVDSNQDGFIDCDEFTGFLRENPEYMQLISFRLAEKRAEEQHLQEANERAEGEEAAGQQKDA